MEDKKKVIVYVDGFNFYYGLKSKKWKMCYWLDLVSFFNSFLKSYQELVGVNYFQLVQQMQANTIGKINYFKQTNVTLNLT